MKSVLISIQPYWVFLIIAKTMGWNIDNEKTVEVRKNYPKSENWDKVAKIYCSKDKKSFAKIPKEYQPLMKQFLGKVMGEFVCDRITEYECSSKGHGELATTCGTCLTYDEIINYCNGYELYGWHISNLVIYDNPRELSEFITPTDCNSKIAKDMLCNTCCLSANFCSKKPKRITRPPQSWCYVESGVDSE